MYKKNYIEIAKILSEHKPFNIKLINDLVSYFYKENNSFNKSLFIKKIYNLGNKK
jgi:hypothetical protein